MIGEKFLKRKAKEKSTIVSETVPLSILKDALIQYYTPLNVFKPEVLDVDIEGLTETANIKIYYRKEPSRPMTNKNG